MPPNPIPGLLLVMLTLLPGTSGAAPQSVPPQAGLLNDYAHIIDSSSAFEIMRMTETLRRDTQAELVVVTLRGIGNQDANDFAERIRTEWQLGGSDGENHPVVVVLYALQAGGFGISYNNVARPYLPHEALDEAFDRRARPELEAGRAGSGLRLLTRALVQLLSV